jgi:hypothetical protein
MTGTIKTPIIREVIIDLVRVQEIRTIGKNLREYTISFYATKWGDNIPLSQPLEISKSIHQLDPRFVSLLEQGIGESGYFDEPNSHLGGATPNQALSQFNASFFGIMEGMQFELIDLQQ